MCRTLSHVATSRLYRNLDLPYVESDPEWKWLEPLYDNKGLQFVRNIDIGYSDVVCEHGMFNICRPLERLLASLRHDSLESLDHGMHGKLNHKQMSSLWRTQKQLKAIHFEIDSGVGSWTMEDLRNEGIREIQSLRLVEEFSVRLGASTNLKEYAELHASMNLNQLQWATLELDQQSREHNNGMITYWNRHLDYDCFSRLLPTCLRSITLFMVALPKDKIVQLQNWVNLTDLRLYDCANVAPMLADLRSHKLTTFICRDQRVYSVESNASAERLRAISSVLSRSKTLETLAVELHGLKNRDLKTIAFDQSLRCHKESLTSLTICCSLFRKFSEAVLDCTKLTEIALWVNRTRVVSTYEVRENIHSNDKVERL